MFLQQARRFLPSLLKQSHTGKYQAVAGFGSDESSTATEPTRIEKTLNNVTLMGRVGVDPQLRGSEEHPVVSFSLATHTNYKYDNGDWGQRTDWHRVVVFKPNLRDTVMQYLKKGRRTMVQGKVTYGEITDTNGNQKLVCSIIADDVIFFKESS